MYLLCTGCQGEEYELMKTEGDWYVVKNKKGYVSRFLMIILVLEKLTGLSTLCC